MLPVSIFIYPLTKVQILIIKLKFKKTESPEIPSSMLTELLRSPLAGHGHGEGNKKSETITLTNTTMYYQFNLYPIITYLRAGFGSALLF